MPALKALTPAGWDVTIVDELIGDVDLDKRCDVVGIGAMGPQIARAYDLADALRARGKKVVLGGPWVSLAPTERSLDHADAVVVGEAEAVWARCLEDSAAGRSLGTYRASDFVHLGGRTLRQQKLVDASSLTSRPPYGHPHAEPAHDGAPRARRHAARGVATHHATDVFSRIDYRDCSSFAGTSGRAARRTASTSTGRSCSAGGARTPAPIAPYKRSTSGATGRARSTR